MKKILIAIAFVFVITFSSVSAQLTLGAPAQQKLVQITIGEQGEVSVLHKIQNSKSAVHVNTVDGTLSNLKVNDVEGNNVEYGSSGLERIEGITIFSSDEDVIIEYDLDDVLFFENGMWSWDFLYLQTTTFILPKNVEIVFVNNNPVMLQDASGITCHGCDANIEYTLEQVTTTKKAQWEEREFLVEFNTMTEISLFDFDQPTKSISFNVEEDNQFITLIIPLELLWSPYEVFVDDTKILDHEFFSNETHAWLNIRPTSSGVIQIIGTTVIPEFPVLAPLFLGIAIVIALQFRNNLNHR